MDAVTHCKSHFVPTGELVAFVKKHGKGRRICVHAKVPARDTLAEPMGLDLGADIEVTRVAALSWCHCVARTHAQNAHVEVTVYSACLYIG